MIFDFLFRPDFIICTILIPFLIQKYFAQIDRLYTSVVTRLIVQLPNKARRWYRNRKVKTTKFIKNNRRSQHRIYFEISKTNSRAMIFFSTILLYLIWMLVGNGAQILNTSFPIGMAMTIPIYISEYFWLKQDLLASKLIRAREKLRKNGDID